MNLGNFCIHCIHFTAGNFLALRPASCCSFRLVAALRFDPALHLLPETKLVFFSLPRPGMNLRSFKIFIHFLSLWQCLRPLGYCAPLSQICFYELLSTIWRMIEQVKHMQTELEGSRPKSGSHRKFEPQLRHISLCT